MVDLVFKLAYSRHFDDLLDIVEAFEASSVARLVDHDVASLVVGVSVFDHVWALMNASETIDSLIVDKEQH